MSKEMLVIALGVWIIVVRTLLGVPGSWQTALFIVSGIALVVVGFLLRGEAISRNSAPRAAPTRSYSFVESAPASPETSSRGGPEAANTHEHKEGITSLN